MFYDRKIKYLDYYEGGTKVIGGGFAKLEVRDNTLRLELTIRGLHPTDSFERDIVLQGAEKEGTLGQIRIQNGCGQFRYSCDADKEIGATGISYSGLRGIRISIGGTREILCQWNNVSDRRRISPSEENNQKSKSGLQESMTESYTDNKMDSKAPMYIENGQTHELRPEKAGEKRKGSKKEEYESIEHKDGEKQKREDKDREVQEGENREGDNREVQEGENRESSVRGVQECESREDSVREMQEGENREGDNREVQEDENREGSIREVQEDESREDSVREMQEGENREGSVREVQKDKNREDKNGRGQEDVENKDKNERKEGKEDTKKDYAEKESRERDNKGLEIKGENMKLDAQPGPTEMQAQGAAMLSNGTSPQIPREPLQTVLQPEEQTGNWAKDKPDMTENNRTNQPDVNKAPVKLMEDKWQQLSAIYPHIQPFHDERDFLSLTPSDFVLFPDRFYRAVNNSFLLHGYYNYHHLILARIERRGETLYYIGVPGNYFEREKQVAIMFGFESFECENEPAKTGDFGYYMMRTEL